MLRKQTNCWYRNLETAAYLPLAVSTVLVRKSTPMVGFSASTNCSPQILLRMLVLPTPGPPSKTTFAISFFTIIFQFSHGITLRTSCSSCSELPSGLEQRSITMKYFLLWQHFLRRRPTHSWLVSMAWWNHANLLTYWANPCEDDSFDGAPFFF